MTLAVKLTLTDPLGTVTDAGTVSAGLLLESFTDSPSVAVVVRFTVQSSIPAPVIVLLLQVNALSAGFVPGRPFTVADPQPHNVAETRQKTTVPLTVMGQKLR